MTATLLVFIIAPLNTVATEPVFYGPSPYFSFNDSPFQALPFDYFHLETFESGIGNLPGVTINAPWITNGPAGLTDSVDADDGNIDGAGSAGHAMFSGGGQPNLIISFNAAALGGHLPTHVGIVVTDIGQTSSGQLGVGVVTLTGEATNALPLGFLVATNFGNGSLLGDSLGATAEDRFLGVSSTLGIAHIRLFLTNSADWEVDHLQFGYASQSIPQPNLQIEFTPPETIALRWPTNAMGFLPQQADEQPSTNWTAVQETPALVGTNYQITQPLVSSNRYFRLIRP